MSEQQKNYAEMSDAEKKKEDWMNSKWRPMMGWSYMLTCIADFVAFPVLWSIVQMIGGGEVRTQWQPITLQGAGLYHIAMGAVLGIAAFGRTQEKLNDKAGSTLPAPSNFSAPAPSFSTPAPAPSFSTPKPVPSFSASSAVPTFSSTGKPMPVQPDQPEL